MPQSVKDGSAISRVRADISDGGLKPGRVRVRGRALPGRVRAGLFADRDFLDGQLAPGTVSADLLGVAVVAIIARIVVEHDALVGAAVASSDEPRSSRNR